MTNQKPIFFAAILIGLTIWLALEHRARREQGLEIAALRQQLAQIEDRLAENGGMSNLATQTRELTQLRDQVRVFHQQTNEIAALRGEVYQVRAAMEDGANVQNRGQTSTARQGSGSNSSRLQVLEAYYWTENKVLDVTQQLRERIDGDKLEVIAGNNLRGDPEFGQVKTLTVLYKYDGITMTNEVREGELLLIPPE